MATQGVISLPNKVTIESARTILNTWPRFLTVPEYTDVLEQLIRSGWFDINNNCSSLLFDAFDNSDVDIIQVLFDHGAKVHNGDALYITLDGDDRAMCVFDKLVVLGCEEVLLQHILSEDKASQAVIFNEIQRKPSLLDTLNRATQSQTFEYKRKFAKLCVLSKTFPTSIPEHFVLRECHENGLTHRSYMTYVDDVEDLKSEILKLTEALAEARAQRDHLQNQFQEAHSKLETCKAIMLQ